MKLSDFVIKFLEKKNIKYIFGMSGGAAVHLFDSVSKSSKVNIISMTNEQFATYAADGYARASNNFGVAFSTSGPGATNMLSGVASAYYDSIPMLIITGQVSRHRQKKDQPIRQLGFQETDTLSIFSPVVKYAVQVNDPSKIKYELEKSYHIAMSGRRGPVLIDLPDDVQRENIILNSLKSYQVKSNLNIDKNIKKKVLNILKHLDKSKRPVIIIGSGVKANKAYKENIKKLVNKLQIPVLPSWGALDSIPSNSKFRINTFGVYGSRIGNFTIQNSDLIISIGSRLSQNLTGGVVNKFSQNSKKIIVDIDKGELNKFNDFKVDIKVCSDANFFINTFFQEIKNKNLKKYEFWLNEIKLKEIKLINKFKDCSPKIQKKYEFLDVKDFFNAYSIQANKKSFNFVDTGGNLTWFCNFFKNTSEQKIESAWNYTPMGYSLPAAIGAAFFHKKNINCIIGDGGLLLCLSELVTVVNFKLPIKIFMINNRSHGIQKQTLETWLKSNMVCVDKDSGLSFPSDWNKLFKSLGLKTYHLSKISDLQNLNYIFKHSGPVITNVEINPDEKLFPFLKYGSSLENQLPESKS